MYIRQNNLHGVEPDSSLVCTLRRKADLELTRDSCGHSTYSWQKYVFSHLTLSYVDYFRCVNSKGEEFEPCKQFYSAFHSLCPNEWVCIFLNVLTVSSRSGMSSARTVHSPLSWTLNLRYHF